MPLDSATLISYKRGIFWQSEYIFCSFFCTFYSEIRHISTSGLHDLITWRSRYLPPNFKFNHPLPRYDTFTSNALCYLVTLTTDLLTLNGCRKFFVMQSNPPPMGQARPKKQLAGLGQAVIFRPVQVFNAQASINKVTLCQARLLFG